MGYGDGVVGYGGWWIGRSKEGREEKLVVLWLKENMKWVWKVWERYFENWVFGWWFAGCFAAI